MRAARSRRRLPSSLRRRRLALEFRHFGQTPGAVGERTRAILDIMAFFSIQGSTTLLNSTATLFTELKGQQEQWCAVVLAEEDLGFWSDPLKAVDLLRCPQVTNTGPMFERSTGVQTFKRYTPAQEVLKRLNTS